MAGAQGDFSVLMKVMYRRVLFTVLTVLWMLAIFWFSDQPAKQSTEMSHRVGHLVGEWIVPGYEGWTPPQKDAFAAAIDYPVRKAAHASEYAVLAVLFLFTFWNFNDKKRINIWVLLAVFLYAVSDELHQYFVPGRAAKLTDVLIDTAGGLVGVGMSRLVIWIRNRIKKH